MAIKEFNVDLDVKGRVLASIVPNSTGSIVTWNTTTNVFGLRTNTQIISDLNLSSNFVPYTGATANVNLGTRSITSTGGFIGNSTTATTLATARTINGTSFNGSANITTDNWGATRNITIGNTTKSVNGSGNVSWSLADIGATTETFVGDAIDNIEIGGRNYVIGPVERGYNLGSGLVPNNRYRSFKTIELPIGIYIISHKTNMGVRIEPSENRTILQGSGTYNFTNPLQIEVTSASDFYISMRNSDPFDLEDDYLTLEEIGFKLEKGNKATDWTPAPEDQVTDWNETNPDSYSFLKNKPLDDIAKGVEAHGWVSLGGVSRTSVLLNSSNDLDLIVEPGYYFHPNAAPLNTPMSTAGYLEVVNSGSTNDFIRQAWRSRNNIHEYQRRRHSNGTWSAWVEYITTENLDSQASSLGFIKSSALPSAQTLSLGTGAGNIAISGGNSVSLSSLSRESVNDSNLPENTRGLFAVTNGNTATGFPVPGASGIGLILKRNNTNTNGSIYFWSQQGGGDVPVYYKTNNNVWRAIASREWANEQGWLKSADISGYATQTWVNQQNFSTQTLSDSTSNKIVSNTVQRAALTGDVTAAQNSNATTIANKAVTLAKMADLTANSLIGRGSGTGVPQRLTLGNKLSISGTEINAEDTTYNAGTLALLNAGTNTENRVWGAKPIADFVKQYAAANLGLQGVTEIGNWTDNAIDFVNGSNLSFTITNGINGSPHPQAQPTVGVPSIQALNKEFLIVNSSDSFPDFSDKLPNKFGILDNTAVWANSFTFGGDFGFHFGYSTGYQGDWVSIGLDTQLHHAERLANADYVPAGGGYYGQSLHFPPENNATLATREWVDDNRNRIASKPQIVTISSGNDSTKTVISSDIGVPVEWLENDGQSSSIKVNITAVGLPITSVNSISLSSINVGGHSNLTGISVPPTFSGTNTTKIYVTITIYRDEGKFSSIQDIDVIVGDSSTDIFSKSRFGFYGLEEDIILTHSNGIYEVDLEFVRLLSGETQFIISPVQIIKN